MPTPAEAILLREQRQRSAPPVWEVGTIQSIGTGSATVLVTGNPETLPYGRTLDGLLAVGDRVVVHRSGSRGYIADAFSSSTVFDTQPPAPTPDLPKSGTTTIVAVDARTWRSDGGWATNINAVIQGTVASGVTGTGAWFYGNTPAAALAGATVRAAAVQLSRRTGGTSPASAHLYLHNSLVRPTGALNAFVLGPIDAPLAVNNPTWVSLPASWGQQIVDHNYGLAISGEPMVAVKGLDQDAMSGQLRLDWTRS